MEPEEELAVYTIGYGSRSFDEVVALLKEQGISCLVDVRTAPYSRFKPEFSKPALEAALPARGLRYVFLGQALGGRPEAPDCYVDGKVDYQLVKQQEFYRRGIDKVRKAWSQGMRLALMCCESRPEECHRSRLIGATLAELSIPVLHLDEEGVPRSHQEVAGRLAGDQLDLFCETTGERSTGGVASIAHAATDLESARQTLKRVFGYDEFRPPQEQLIANVLQGRDSLGVMPTGAGKSLCYQLPALLTAGLTVVVSPLLSLMQDQVDQLRQLGVPAVSLNSMLGHAEYVANMRQVRSGDAKLLYVAPETLLRPETMVLLEEARVSCITVDEAHCISEWGHDFRPEYRKLRHVRERFPKAVCLALTATATPRVRSDIQTILGIPPANSFVAGFDRPNLHLEVRRRDNGARQVLEFLASHPDEQGIVYCSTREQVETLVAQLTAEGIRALPYHAGMDDRTRRENQRLFQRDEVQVIVATVAFGMGINKSNVRFVLHHALPDCLETYYQQVGRAGRDGLRSECLLLFARGDVGTISHFIQEGAPAERQGRTARLQAMVRFAESTSCRRRTLLTYFGDEAPQEACGMCDNCVSEAAGRVRVDVSEEARLFLTCLKETRERFGRTHVVEVLRGSNSARVQKWRHDQLPSHGSGRKHSAEHWRVLSDRFIELELVEAEVEHGTLRLLPGAARVLAGEPVFVVLDEPRSNTRAVDREAHDPLLFEALRRLRKEIADAANVPPYVIFSDRTLTEMAAAYPLTRPDLLRVHGIGEHKAELYGDRLMEVIRAHVAEHGITPPPPPRPAPEPRSGRRFEEVGDAFAAGQSLDELRERWGVTRETIVQHLVTYFRSGRALDPQRLLAQVSISEDLRERALQRFTALGHQQLGPVYAALDEMVPYVELHLLRLYLAALHAEAADV